MITVGKPSTNAIVLGKDNSGRITVTFQYDPLRVAKAKTIEGRKWHPTLCVIARRSVRPTKQSIRHASSKTTEIYTHVSSRSLGKITSPLDTIDLAKGGGE